MRTRRFTRLPGLAFAVLLTLLVGQDLVFGDDDDKMESRKLEGTWNVTLQFPVCSTECPCPGGVPNIPIPALHMYLKARCLPGNQRWEPLSRPWAGVVGAHRPPPVRGPL
jgi:hypothetical protein